MSYQLNKSHLLICIVAALVITAGFIIHHLLGLPFGLFTMALWVSLVIVIFYVVGHIARAILIGGVFTPEETTELTEEESEEEAELEGEELPEGMMEYSTVEAPLVENEHEQFYPVEDDFSNHEPTAEELMESLAMGDVS